MSQEIDRQAAAWVVKTLDDHFDLSHQAALEGWLAADPRHLGAFARASAILARVDQTRAIGPDYESLRHGSARRPSRRIFMEAGAIAASITVLGIGVGAVWRALSEGTASTGIGETDVVPLADESIVTLNTNSKVVLRYTEAQRGIELVHGEALFDVAKDPRRPFIVRAGDTEVSAIGTSFVVRALPDQPVEVLVREGIVEVKRPKISVAAPVRVVANVRAVAPSNAPIVTSPVTHDDIARDLAWKDGKIAFDDESLADAAREFARYSKTPILIEDPEVATRTVTGLFMANDPAGFAKAVAISLGIHAEIGDRQVLLTRHKSAMTP
jgi:transmembrane sensor